MTSRSPWPLRPLTTKGTSQTPGQSPNRTSEADTTDAYGRYMQDRLLFRVSRAHSQQASSTTKTQKILTQNVRGFTSKSRPVWMAAWRHAPRKSRPDIWFYARNSRCHSGGSGRLRMRMETIIGFIYDRSYVITFVLESGNASSRRCFDSSHTGYGPFGTALARAPDHTKANCAKCSRQFSARQHLRTQRPCRTGIVFRWFGCGATVFDTCYTRWRF